MSRPILKVGDWICNKCNQYNFSKNIACRKCESNEKMLTVNCLTIKNNKD